MQQTEKITLWEFMRPGWTYHAKGLWYTLPNQQKPSLTLIGSPNFGNFKLILLIESNTFIFFNFQDTDQ